MKKKSKIFSDAAMELQLVTLHQFLTVLKVCYGHLREAEKGSIYTKSPHRSQELQIYPPFFAHSQTYLLAD